MGHVRLEEMTVYEVRELMKQIRKDENIPLPTKKKLVVVARIAKRHIKLTEHRAQFSGKYKETFPNIARGICKTFYADNDELAACFSVSPATIERWRRSYPDFDKAIIAGKFAFARYGGSQVLCRRWFRPTVSWMADRIRNEFDASKKQLLRCFAALGLSARSLADWRAREYWEREWWQRKKAHDELLSQMVYDICAEFNPDDAQLARCLGFGVAELKERIEKGWEFSRAVRCGRKMAASGGTRKMMRDFDKRLGSESDGEVGTGRGNEERE
jgi:hypothetical protein